MGRGGSRLADGGLCPRRAEAGEGARWWQGVPVAGGSAPGHHGAAPSPPSVPPPDPPPPPAAPAHRPVADKPDRFVFVTTPRPQPGCAGDGHLWQNKKQQFS